ncbi:MAG: VWA domain-containing protein [Planctomycetes bacterium]|nr:VWA domain-containing protein [Planctomycetota bacterium]
MPAAQQPDMVSPAFEHMMAFGTLDYLTEEQLAEAVEIDPSQIAGFGPSIAALLAMLEQRKQKILQTYETDRVQELAASAFRESVQAAEAPEKLRDRFDRAVREEQIAELDALWYLVDQRSDFARQLVQINHHLGNKYQIEELAAEYVFCGKQAMSIEEALKIKDELEAIDRLIEQLKEAAKNAKIYLIDMEALARFADQEQMENLAGLQRHVQQLLEQMAAEQGLRRQGGKYNLTPKAFRIFQTKLLDRIFADLQAGKSGRHRVELDGDGAVELQRTKPYEFGDSLANMDVGSSMINAMIRNGPGLPIRMKPEDIEIHLTRNSPKCATVVCMDMSGSMRWGGQYINVKRMALALHGLIRTEYPGDFVDFVEIATLPKRRHISEVPELLPKPVTISDSVVRLKADMSDPDITEFNIHPHFTNIQHGLALARQMLQVQDTPNRQIILITDGMPTAHFEDQWLFMLYPPDPRTEQHTLREGLRCRQQDITINIFLLSSWSQSEEDVQFANRLAEQTTGRVFFVGGNDLDRFVVWDYLQRRRTIIG